MKKTKLLLGVVCTILGIYGCTVLYEATQQKLLGMAYLIALLVVTLISLGLFLLTKNNNNYI